MKIVAYLDEPEEAYPFSPQREMAPSPLRREKRGLILQ